MPRKAKVLRVVLTRPAISFGKRRARMEGVGEHCGARGEDEYDPQRKRAGRHAQGERQQADG
jgi:hypothetical protein